MLQLLYPLFLLGRFIVRPLLRRIENAAWWKRLSGLLSRAVQAVGRWFRKKE
jgi:hypothetical protein